PSPQPYPLSLPDALPISSAGHGGRRLRRAAGGGQRACSGLSCRTYGVNSPPLRGYPPCQPTLQGVDDGELRTRNAQAPPHTWPEDRKSTRLNSSHVKISY